MKRSRAIIFLVVVILALLTVWQFRGLRSTRLYDGLEANARKVVTAAELQSWATNLLAIDPYGTNLEHSWGEDFPKALLRLAPRTGPLVAIHNHTLEDTNSLPWVQVYWGSGVLGHSGFEIGGTDFVSWYAESHQWAPGVYFFRRE